MDNLWILAETAAKDAASGITSEQISANETTQTITTVASDSNAMGEQAPPVQRNPIMQFLPIILIFVAMYFFLFRGPRKKQQEHKQMVQSLKKNDKVCTIGGIIGTIVEIKPDEIILKVDESNNTKIRIAHTAIGKNVTKE
ncbi:MAG: preprotein translocase subunit YajC [Planctomycetes bacterium]|nr:preprotein translocase subunit YajC [Planctomycetota bacterium]